MKYYRSRSYKYQLAEEFTYILSEDFPDVEFEWSSIRKGKIIISKGYAWDGASGPTIDTKNSMVAALVHDALYQLIRTGHLELRYRLIADEELHTILREHGMNPIRAFLWKKAVNWFGKSYAIQLRDVDQVLEVN